MLRFLLFVSIIILCCACQEKAIEQQKPNVVFILADDLGYHDLSCMGSKYYETPHIDRIAKEGVVFSQGYAACQVCSPSRAAIMTGKYPARLGITDWIGAKTGEAWREHNRHDKLLPAENNDHLPFEDVSLAEAMQAGGYQTFFAGKWHIGNEGSYPEDHGFNINKGGWEKGSPIGGFFAPWTNPRLEYRDTGENLTLRLAEETAQFIREKKDQPFFAFLSFYAVHGPIQCTQEKWKKYRDKAERMGTADSGFEMERHLPIRRTQDNPVYAGLVEAMDDAVGIVLQTLDELGLEDNTVVIFTSDNGGVASGDAFSTSNLPLRGGKGYQWEGGIREPYFIKAPVVASPGTQNPTPVSGIDFYPTILDLAGISTPVGHHIDGVSLLPALKGESIAARPLYWHYPHYGNQGGDPSAILRDGDWKLIHYFEDDRRELYNLLTDLSESQDLAASHLDRVSSMGQQLEQWLQDVGARVPTPDPQYDAAQDDDRHQRIVNELWPRLEQRRKDMLSEDYVGPDDWWSSAKATE